MKKGIVITLSIISFVFTFVFAELFSLYHFGTIPTLSTLLHLLSIFVILDYLFISVAYICKKKINKQKIGIKKIVSLLLLFVAILLIVSFLIVVNIDWFIWYTNSSPFYINVIVRGVEFLLPSSILVVVSIVLMKKER